MFGIANQSQERIPNIQWEKIKKSILGEKYELSLVFANNSLMKKLNRQYRKKNKLANTLSFVFDKSTGEIFLNHNRYKLKNELLTLFIHSLLHLKGFSHNEEMREQEAGYLKKFKA
ncbi:MAG: rRNA maturation RNase YbeY [bacterium]|nr:rRNA maturation RNase YbeY [bacterium]